MSDTKLIFTSIFYFQDGKEAGQFDSVNGKQNFVCKLDGYEFVEQFVEHYFNSFDSFNRYSFIKGNYNLKELIETGSVKQ